MLYLGVLAAAGLGAPGFSAGAVLFQDNFEANAVGTVVGPPTIGTSWVDGSTFTPPTPSADDAIKVVASPALDTRAIRLDRQATSPVIYNPTLRGYSLPGAIVDGNTVEVKWSLNHEFTHSFNSPMQIGIGQDNSNLNNDLAYISIGDANSGSYGWFVGPGQRQTRVDTLTHPSRNTLGANEGKWDALRVLFHLSLLDATHMSGTFDVFVDVNGVGEVQLGANQLAFTTTLSTATDPTVMQFRILKGVSSGFDYYDNVSIEVIPEPAAMGLGAAVCGLMVLRRRNRS